MLALFVLLMLALFFIRRNAGAILKKLKQSCVFLIFMLIFQLFFAQQGNTLIGWGPLRLTDVSLYESVHTGLRLFNLILLLMLFIETTKQSQFLLALRWYLTPLTFIKFPVDATVLLIKMILRFIPLLSIEAKKIEKAQASRGLDRKSSTSIKKMKLMGALMMPTLVNAIKRTDELANAMATRGFVLNQTRTAYRTFKKGDRA